MAKYTIADFQREFPDDDACLDRILLIRYGDEPVCPGCEHQTKFHRVSGRRQYACQRCGHHVAPCAGTVFEKSSTSLWKWFYAMYLFTASRHGVPAKELERQLGVTYKTAWRMGHKLRELMDDVNGSPTFTGHVEVDESYFGGKYKVEKRGGGYAGEHKAVVMGLLERGGAVHTEVIPGIGRRNVDPTINRHVVWGSTVSTDEAAHYSHLGGLAYNHGRVRHKRKEWKKGIHHTNNIEGYWSRLKNSIKGTHVHVSQKYLPRYTAEFAFRYNNRKVTPAAMFDRCLSGLLRRH